MKSDPFYTGALGLVAMIVGVEILLAEVFLPQYMEKIGFLSLGIVAIGSGLLAFLPTQIMNIRVDPRILAPIREDLAVLSAEVEEIREVVAPRRERVLAKEFSDLENLLRRVPEQEIASESPAET